jgi:hypothetical protein
LTARRDHAHHFNLQANKKRIVMVLLAAMAVRVCAVSFTDARGVRHSVEVEAESLYHAVVLGVARLRKDPWIERVGEATPMDVEVRAPATKHTISLQQVERWLAGATANPTEASKKARLKMLLVQS